MPGGSAAFAASMYLLTLSVENCGAIGMPMTRVTPAAASSAIASGMNGVQLRMPTATGMSGPSAARSAAEAAAARRRRLAAAWRVGGGAPPADGAVVLAHLVHELLGRRAPAA